MFGASRKAAKLVRQLESFYSALEQGENALSGEIGQTREAIRETEAKLSSLEQTRNRVSALRGGIERLLDA